MPIYRPSFPGNTTYEKMTGLGYVTGGWPAIAESAENEGDVSFPNDFRRSFVEPQEFDGIHIATGFQMNCS